MRELRLLISYGGQWFGQNYEGGDSEMVFVPPDLTYHGLMNRIEDIVRIDSSTFNIELRVVMTTSGRRAIPRIKNDEMWHLPVCWSNTMCGSIPSILDGKQPPTIPSSSKQKRSAVNDPAYTINDASLGVGTNNEVGANTSEFETFVDNGLDGLPEPYPFEQDVDVDGDSDSVFDLDGDSDTDSHNGDIDGESESGYDLDGDSDGDSGSDGDGDANCGCELDVDNDGYGHDRGDSFAAPLPWIISGAEKYSIQTINNDELSISNGHFYKGKIYSTKQELKRDLRFYALRERFEFRIKRSDKKRFEVGCKNDNCVFKLGATKMHEGKYWQVQKYNKEHSCTLDGFHGRFRQASASIIGELYSPKLRVNGTTLKPKDIMTEMELKYGLQILYTYLLNARNEFRYCFFAYGACLHGFRAVIWPVIAIDGTHLKGRFRGILFIAVCKDANEQVYPLAFGIGQKESRKSWSWFLKQLGNCIGCPEDCMFISDQHKGIAKAMEIVYPNASHGLCGFHMVMNIKNMFKKEDVTGIFKRASKCYKESEFIDEMNQLRRVHPNAYDYLMKIGKKKWSRAYSPMPVTVLIEFIRDMMQKWFHDRLNLAKTLRTHLATWETTLLNQRNEESTMFTAGRPKKSKIPSSGEYRGKKSRTCSWCKQIWQ
ncbi:hypothetical protein Ddye_011146 [Dipteronia dyeriana]|uniref:Transposase n=1 Tax=Dipteronia dyeriana TaxID=168575 RepID=A0AAD9XEQ6_9ROSI|nr:hypothetical protein Ddye_011146 [Dipteronia dyeriana]